MAVTIRIDISATVKGHLLFSDLDIEFTDAVERLLKPQNYSINKIRTGFTVYLVRRHDDANPSDLNDYVEDRLDSIQTWIQGSRYYDLFTLGLVTIDINENRFQYKPKPVGLNIFEWEPF